MILKTFITSRALVLTEDTTLMALALPQYRPRRSAPILPTVLGAAMAPGTFHPSASLTRSAA